jgi:hypothetical protein
MGDEMYFRQSVDHLLKTFCSGWNDRQLPDGTVIWTTPTGVVDYV